MKVYVLLHFGHNNDVSIYIYMLWEFVPQIQLPEAQVFVLGKQKL